jgi:5-methylcytosine-specific restriction protein A
MTGRNSQATLFSWMQSNHFGIDGAPGGSMFDSDDDFMQRERQKAKDLKKSRWWQNLIQKTQCYYCQLPISRELVTMDHIVPISRGGRSTPGNLVPACKNCNVQKRSLTPVEWESYLQSQKP